MKIYLRQNILNAILTDDSFSEKNESNIKRIYMTLTTTDKTNVNKIFINLCGYSLETFLNAPELHIDRNVSKIPSSDIGTFGAQV